MSDHIRNPSLANPDALGHRMVQCAHNRDGLPELVAGVTFVIASGMCWPEAIFRGRPGGLLGLAFTVLVLVMCGIANWLITSIRQRYLLPWVGYVKLHRRRYPKSTMVIVFVQALVVAGAIAALMRYLEARDHKLLLLPINGIFIGTFQFIAGRLPRFWITGTLAICAGIGLAFTNWSFELCLALLYSFVGIVELTAGGIVLAHLLQQRTEIEA
jgi:hypothetical protein